jgi:hypothetical protein
MLEGTMDKDDDTGQYWTRPTASKQSSTPKDHLPISTSPDRAGQHRSDWIRKCALQIFGSYRKDDFADPDSYLVQLGMVLERYDDATIRAVTSPVTGIQRSCKFPPSIAEFVEFIDEHIRRASFAQSYDAHSADQLREREQIEREAVHETLEHRRAAAERILAEYKAQLTPETKPKRPTWQRLSDDDLRAAYPPKP